jgi:hypothetical protein
MGSEIVGPGGVGAVSLPARGHRGPRSENFQKSEAVLRHSSPFGAQN